MIEYLLYDVRMYIAVVPNRGSNPTTLLRESFREDGKVKNRTLANLSSWPAARVDAFRRLLRGELDHLADATPVCGPAFGLLFALKQIADRLGISAALGRSPIAKFALFLVLARIAHRGSRLSAVRWARDHAVAEVLGLPSFDEDDLYAALDDLSARQSRIEAALFRNYRKTHPEPPSLFLYDVTSAYLEGERNELAQFGYNRDGKRGKLQIVIGLLTDQEGEPLAVRVFEGNTNDPMTVADQIAILRRQFGVAELVLVGDRGMIKSKGKQALNDDGLRYISALTDPQIRKLLSAGTIQMALFTEQVAEVEDDGLRYVLRKNDDEAARVQHRLEDKLTRLKQKIEERNQQVAASPRCKPDSGLAKIRGWIARHKLASFIEPRLDKRELRIDIDEAAREQAMLLAGCYAIVTDVDRAGMAAQDVHDNYMRLQKVERDFRTMKTGLLEVRPIFVRKEERTRGHVFCSMLALKIVREMERRLRTAYGTTDSNAEAVTLPDALTALGRLCLLQYNVDGEHTVTRLPIPSESQTEILKALGVSLPSK
jgi:transposase